MGSLSFGEILTIILVILIIFGPNRLPEFSRKVGEFVARARNATSEFASSIQNEMGDDGETLRGISDDIAGIRKGVSDAASAFTRGPKALETTSDASDDSTTEEFPEVKPPDDNGRDGSGTTS